MSGRKPEAFHLFDHFENDPEQISLLRRLIALGPAVQKARAAYPEKIRRWERAAHRAKAQGEYLSLRHPELHDEKFQDIPEFEKIRVSRSVHRGRQGYFHSQKNGRTMHFRARLEYEFMRLNEVKKSVASFVEHPVELRYPSSDGAFKRHIPDLYVLENDEASFYEVKWERDASTPENERRWPDIGNAFSRMGFTYEVITERTIRREPRHSNVVKIFKARRIEVSSEAVDWLSRRMAGQPTRIGDLLESHTEITFREVYALIENGTLVANIEEALTEDALVIFWGSHV